LYKIFVVNMCIYNIGKNIAMQLSCATIDFAKKKSKLNKIYTFKNIELRIKYSIHL